MRLRPDTALTFDDVLLVPRRWAIRSRQAVNTRTCFSRRIEIAIPIVSSNMDTVTESAMAMAMGGIGVIHRFMTVERQAADVACLKGSESFMVDHPYSLPGAAAVSEAQSKDKKERPERSGRSSFSRDAYFVGHPALYSSPASCLKLPVVMYR
jgi:IMP dehydrogenase